MKQVAGRSDLTAPGRQRQDRTAPRPIGRSLAQVIAELLAPANLAAGLLLVVGWHSDPGFAGLGWGLLAATFCGVIPCAVIIYGVRRGQWTDRHLPIRSERKIPLLAGLSSVIAGLTVLVALDAPRELVALVAAMLAGLAVTLAITVRWKVSVHSAVASGAAATLALTFGPHLAAAAPAAALVAWSRVRLGHHTPAQAMVGAAVGALIATTLFDALR